MSMKMFFDEYVQMRLLLAININAESAASTNWYSKVASTEAKIIDYRR